MSRKLSLIIVFWCLLTSGGAYAQSYYGFGTGSQPTGSEIVGPIRQNGGNVNLPLSAIVGQTPIQPTGATSARKEVDRATDRFSIRDFGAKCDGSDDGVSINNALIAAGAAGASGGVVTIPNATCRFGVTLNVPDFVHFVGAGPSASVLQPLSPNLNPNIKMGNHSIVDQFMLVSGSSTMGYPAAGTVGIDMGSRVPGFSKISDVWIDGACIPIELSGNSDTVDRSFLNGTTHAGCYGIRVGHYTTGASTVDPRITNTTVATATDADADMRIEDAGGLFLSNNDNLFAKIGTQIIPGANQQVTWLFGSNTVLGDTNSVTSMTVNTGASGALVQGLFFNGSWWSNSPGPAISLTNTGGGVISGVHVIGSRIYSTNGDAVDVTGSVTDFSLEHSSSCGNSGSGTGVYIGQGVTRFRVLGNLISATCDGFTSNSKYGITLVGNNDEGVVTGNDLNGLNTPVNIGSSLPNANLIIKDNIPTTTQSFALPIAVTLALSSGYENYGITNANGTSPTITNITGTWNGRHVTLYAQGAMNFASGGDTGSAICNPSFTSVPNVPVEATYFACWYLK